MSFFVVGLADSDAVLLLCVDTNLSVQMFPTFSFFVRSILSSSALAASVPSAKSFFRFSSSSASRCSRFSRCSRIIRLLSMFGWKLSSSSESSIRSHLLSAIGVCEISAWC